MIWFWVIVIVLVVGGVAIVVVGRDTELADVYEDRPDVGVPAQGPLTAEDLRQVRLSTAVRGYRMDEVDALLARLGEQLETPPENPPDNPPDNGPDNPPDHSSDDPSDNPPDHPPDAEAKPSEPTE